MRGSADKMLIGAILYISEVLSIRRSWWIQTIYYLGQLLGVVMVCRILFSAKNMAGAFDMLIFAVISLPKSQVNLSCKDRLISRIFEFWLRLSF